MGLGSKIKKIRSKIKHEIKHGAQKAFGKDIGRFIGNYTNQFIGGTDDLLKIMDPLTWNSNTAKFSPSNWKYDAAAIGGLAGGALYGLGSLYGMGATGGTAQTAAETMGAGRMGFSLGNALGFNNGGLGSLLGGIGSSVYSAQQAKEAQQKQIAWERERAQNAHQWEVKDLMAAGLNPILSAGGQGATTGGISAPVGDTTGIANAMPNAMSAILTAEQTKNAAAERDNIGADTQLKTMQALEAIANTDWLKAKEKEAISNTAKTYAQTMLFDQQYKQQNERFQKELDLLQEQIRLAQLTNDEKKLTNAIKEYENAMKKWTWWLNQINQGGRTMATGLMAVNMTAKTVMDAIPTSKLIGFIK